MKTYLFLDIDGVLFTLGGCIYHRLKSPERMPHKELDPVALALLTRLLLENPEIQIVISSTWRRTHTIEEIKEALGQIIGNKIIGITPSLKGGYRGAEIKAWLELNAPTATPDNVLILDDDADMNPFFGCLFLTDSHNGFTARDFCKIKDYLKSTSKERQWIRFKKEIDFKRKTIYWKTRGYFRRLQWKIKAKLEKISK